MEIIATCREMTKYSSSMRKAGATTGLVPTMGALHGGHLSLLEAARRHCDCTIMSIFVNPAQFGPAEDFDKYPRSFEKDRELAESAGCDCLFTPAAAEMYPENYGTYVDVGNVAAALCGASRPTHFRGVATVVLKLFNVAIPDIAVFGAKDAQQVVVIRRMVKDLNVPVRIIAAPTVREADGLAMSSRNAYLSPAERAEAAVISRSLVEAKKSYDGGERDGRSIKSRVLSTLGNARLIIPEYVEIVDTILVKPLAMVDEPALVAIACRTAETGTRLIDNIVLDGDL